MHRRFKVVLAGLLILAVVVAPITTHFRAKARLHAFKEELEAGRAKIATDQQPPALTPEEIRAGLQLMAAAARLGFPYSNAPVMKFLAPGRALAACKEEVLLTEDSTNIWPGLYELLAQGEDALAQTRAILSDSSFGFDFDYRQTALALPHLARMKALTQWLALAAAVDLHAHQITNAAEDLDALATLVAHYKKDSLQISALVRAAMAAIAINVTWEALQGPEFTDAQLHQLQARWESVELLAQAESALATEQTFGGAAFAAGRQSFSAINSQPPSGGTYLAELAGFGKEILDDPGQGLQAVFHRYLGYWRWKYWQSYDDEIANAKALQAGLEAVRHARVSRIPNLALSDFEHAAARIRNAHPAAAKWLGSSALDTLPRFFTRIRTIEIQRSLLITAIALKRYELKQGNFPNDLSALTPEFLAGVPGDPIDGQPTPLPPKRRWHLSALFHR